MANKIIHNQLYIPHQAIVFTNQKNINDFSLGKVGIAYRMRSDCIGEDRAIWELEFHPTNRCNLHCVGCSYGTRHNGLSLTVDKIKSVLEQYMTYDLKSVFFSGGGDPLMWRYWDDFFATIKKTCSYGIATNMFNFHEIKEFWNMFDFYQIHIIGYDAETSEAATGVDSFQRIDKNISFLLNHKMSSQDIVLKILVNEENYCYLPRFLDYVVGRGASSIILKYQQDFLINQDLANNEILDTVRHIAYSHALASEYDYLLDNLDDILYSIFPRPAECLFANSGLYRLINAEGEIFPCIASNANKKNKINNETGFVDVYSKEMRDGKCPLKACRHYRFSQYLSQTINMGCLSSDMFHVPLLL